MTHASTKKLLQTALALGFLALTGEREADGEEAAVSSSSRPVVVVEIAKTLGRLIAEEDTDGDRKITVDDRPAGREGRGDKRFSLIAADGRVFEVSGTYFLSNLLQELELAGGRSGGVAAIDFDRVFENPVRRISRSIGERFWDALTRRIDADNLEALLGDEKIAAGGVRYLYVPATDAPAFAYFSKIAAGRPALRLRVARLPATVTAGFVRDLGVRHGLLSLALERTAEGAYAGVPFVVPGGRFNEMYGWDSYFEALGLLRDGRVGLAKAMVDNFVYQITHYGKILNANRTYYLTRSQPPFLTSMALAVYRRLPPTVDVRRWLAGVMRAAIEEYHGVWMNHDRLTDTGLSRYFGSGRGPPPEVERGHFDAIYRPYAHRLGLETRKFESLYKAGRIAVPELDRFFVHDRCVRESGHDTTYRFEGDRCADFVTVDLNALLYKMEIDIGRTIERVFGGRLAATPAADGSSAVWYARAAKRKRLIDRYLWDERRGMYFDYDVVNKRRYAYVSATTLYPLWAWHGDDPSTRLVERKRAARLVRTALAVLEMPGGVAASSLYSRGPVTDARPVRQWDYPNGWAPHQMLIWRGLLNHRLDRTAHRLIYRWLYTITRNAADYNGTIPEKLDVVKRSHKVFAEYGNVGTKFAYITKEGFGWMNASYQVGLSLLPPGLRARLERLVPPESIFAN